MLYNIALYGMTMGAPTALLLLRLGRLSVTGVWPTINLISITGILPQSQALIMLMSIPLELWLISIGLLLTYTSRH